MKIAKVLWEKCRRDDGSIDLLRAARQTGCRISPAMEMYLSFVEEIRPVSSRQTAALALATAMALYSTEQHFGDASEQ